MKAEHISIASKFEDMPNVGPAVASLLRDAGYSNPQELDGEDAKWLYDKICQITRTTHNPQLLDRLLSAIDFAAGNPPKSLGEFAERRAILLNNIPKGSV